MRPFVYYIPVAVFLIVGVLSGAAVNLRDPRFVRRPSGLWSPVRLLRDEEWTSDGLAARRRMWRGLAIAVAAAALAWIAVFAFAGQA